MVTLSVKPCSKCGEVKPIDQFGPDRRKTTGLKTQCRSCQNAYRKPRAEWTEDKREQARLARRRWRSLKKDQKAHVLEYRQAEREAQHRRARDYQSLKAVPAGMKRCMRCFAMKKCSAFGSHRGKKDGLDPWCRSCVRERESTEERQSYRHARRVARAPEIRAARREYQRRKRQERQAKGLVRKWGTNRTPELVLAASHRRRAARLGIFHELVLLSVLLKRDKSRCQICRQGKRRGDKWSVDHILPISLGGNHSYANTHLAHLSCNIARGNRGAAQMRLFG